MKIIHISDTHGCHRWLPELPEADIIVQFVKDAIITQRPVPESLFRERTVWNYPEGAIRELLMNACMHRDYQSNMPIRLYQFDDYIEVMNAGGLYGEARPENFPSVNDYRNPLVAEAMRVMKYVNKFNRGVTRVQEMLKDNGNPPAEFDVNTITAFRVNVHATNESDLSKGTSQPLSQSIEEKIVEFCKEPRSLTEIMRYLGYKDRVKFKKKYINPLLGFTLTMTIPEKPNSRNQKYVVRHE